MSEERLVGSSNYQVNCDASRGQTVNILFMGYIATKRIQTTFNCEGCVCGCGCRCACACAWACNPTCRLFVLTMLACYTSSVTKPLTCATAACACRPHRHGTRCTGRGRHARSSSSCSSGFPPSSPSAGSARSRAGTSRCRGRASHCPCTQTRTPLCHASRAVGGGGGVRHEATIPRCQPASNRRRRTISVRC